MIRKLLYLCTVLNCFLLTECKPDTGTDDPVNKPETKLEEQFNISVLIDLSDRIDSSGNEFSPPQYQRDTAIIHAIIDIFKKNLQAPGRVTFNAKDKFKIFFHPVPQDPQIALIAQNLQLDMEPMDPKQKKNAFLRTDSIFAVNLMNIYDLALKKSKYEGADIWHFMKDDVKNKCVKDTTYRNILIILTDGYMYWPFDKRNEKNRYNYIGPKSNQLTMFRGQNSWEEKFNAKDYGFIAERNDLSDLEILVIGVSTPKSHPEDYDILKKYWGKWFTEMGVRHYYILQTDQPVNTKNELDIFFNAKTQP